MNLSSGIHALGLCMVSCFGLFLCFLLFYHVAGQNATVKCAWLICVMALGSFPLSHPRIPRLPCIRYTAIITAEKGQCYLLFFLCVNFCNCRYRSTWGF
jgi:hypothetical protein